MNTQDKAKKMAGFVKEIGNSSSQKPKNPMQQGECTPRQNVFDPTLDNQLAIKCDILSAITACENNIGNRINAVIELLNDNSRNIEKTNYELLKFIQNLNVYLEDSRINPDFAGFVQEEIKGVLSIYGYRLVDFEHPYENCYEVEIEDIHEVGLQIVRRAIVDKENNLIVQGKIWKKQE